MLQLLKHLILTMLLSAVLGGCGSFELKPWVSPYERNNLADRRMDRYLGNVVHRGLFSALDDDGQIDLIAAFSETAADESPVDAGFDHEAHVADVQPDFRRADTIRNDLKLRSAQ